jgi:hypothetical protein
MPTWCYCKPCFQTPMDLNFDLKYLASILRMPRQIHCTFLMRQIHCNFHCTLIGSDYFATIDFEDSCCSSKTHVVFLNSLNSLDSPKI